MLADGELRRNHGRRAADMSALRMRPQTAVIRAKGRPDVFDLPGRHAREAGMHEAIALFGEQPEPAAWRAPVRAS